MPWPYSTYASSPINGVMVVEGKSAAAQVMCPVGKTMLMDADEPVFYIKTCEANGASYVEAYRFEKIEDMPPVPLSKDDIKEIVKEVLDESDSGSCTQDA